MATVQIIRVLLLSSLWSSSSAFTFLAVGDWGAAPGDSKKTRTMNKVAQSLTNYAAQSSPKFVLAMGDNFYDDGVTSTTDPQWESTWRRTWVDPFPQMHGVKWLPLLGNHDYHPGIEGANFQVARSGATDDDEWDFDSRSWTRKLSVSKSSSLMLISIDTEEMVPNTYPITEQLFSERESSQAVDELESKLLAASEDPSVAWIIVVGHYPVFSNGHQHPGHDGGAAMRKLILPMLIKYGVDAYISGHDHTLQHIGASGVHFIVSANGCDPSGSLDKDAVNNSPGRDTFLATTDPGFTAHQIDGQIMKTSFINEDGKVIHSFEQTPRCKRNCASKDSYTPRRLDKFSFILAVIAPFALLAFAITLLLLDSTRRLLQEGAPRLQIEFKDLKFDLLEHNGPHSAHQSNSSLIFQKTSLVSCYGTVGSYFDGDVNSDNLEMDKGSHRIEV